MKKIKLPKTFLTITSLSLMCCASIPIKPVVERCRVDVIDGICRCAKTGGSNEPVVDRELKYCDSFEANSPYDTGLMDNYLHDLENYIHYNCSTK